jgi:2-keto-4-pentenoate hydratase/2-oxohepta-3-ene-1,7-dioic acid hydratase in catechol pathway
MKIICVGRNYKAHIDELQNQHPEEPVLFLKPDTAVLLKKQPFFIPDFSDQIHYEVEVLVRINKLGKHISPRFASSYYSEIGLGIDFTARDLQDQLKQKGLPWEKAKGFDGSAVIGHFIPKNQLPPVDQLEFYLDKNGTRVQQGNTAEMLWNIDALISYISQFFTLKIGDIIFTGTPAGVGKVVANDTLTGYLEGHPMFSIVVK